jgi:hypothetical protein
MNKVDNTCERRPTYQKLIEYPLRKKFQMVLVLQNIHLELQYRKIVVPEKRIK